MSEVDENRFFNRDLSWLEFNDRVLCQAKDKRVPLLERVRFLSIFTSNLDEFFMKRVGRLQRMISRDVTIAGADGMYPAQVLKEVHNKVNDLIDEQTRIFEEEIVPELKENGIELVNWNEISEAEKDRLNRYFSEMIFPILTPLAVDPAHPFPFLSNLSLSLGLRIHAPDSDETLFARVKIPDALPQWVKVTEDEEQDRVRMIRLMDIIVNNLDKLFPKMIIDGYVAFRVTRNADLGEGDFDDEEQDDVVELVEEELRRRRVAHVVRLEHGEATDSWIRNYVVDEIDLDADDVFEVSGELNFRGLEDICKLDFPQLKFRPWMPITPQRMLDDNIDIFQQIRDGDILVHHPYESFSSSVEKFVRVAVDDPSVFAIKLTVYRTGSDSPFIPLLIEAAENGKQVVCVLEVKARFDEARNLLWAEKLEKAGVHVVYGVIGLKTHAKLAMIVRREQDKFKVYTHIGTGNYHGQTAKLYTDVGLFTCNEDICSEVVEVFNSLTGISLNENYDELLVSPVNMRQKFLALIDKEIEFAQNGHGGRIVAKMNSLEDVAICEKLYEASNAGVQIDLIVRGFCCLRPGVEGLSTNIRVHSIVGRFLEHSRIYFFGNGKNSPEEGVYYIGSADWMRRNLNDRVEVITPTLDSYVRRKLWQLLQLNLEDKVQRWELLSDGTHKLIDAEGSLADASQSHFMDLARGRTYG